MRFPQILMGEYSKSKSLNKTGCLTAHTPEGLVAFRLVKRDGKEVLEIRADTIERKKSGRHRLDSGNNNVTK